MAAPAITNVDPATDKSPRRRRWIPLSLRMFVTLLALLGTASTLLTWVTYRREQQVYHREQRLLHEVQSLGGSFGNETGGSEWLRQLASKTRLFDVKVFQRISFILIDGGGVTDAQLATFHLGELTNLNGVSFDKSAVTDAGLAELRGLKNLQQVSVNGTGVTDAGVAHLRGLTNLRYLLLSRTAVTDAGLAHVSGLKSLEYLFLERTAVTDAGLTHLYGLTSLKVIRLINTKVTDAGVAKLQLALPNLTIVR